MAAITTGQGLKNHALFRCGEKTDGTSDYATQIEQYVLDALNDVHAAAPFYFVLADPPGVLSLVAKVAATVTSIAGTTWTLSGTIATSQAGKKVYLDSEQIIYRIITHTAGTATLAVDAAYAETVTSGPCTIFQDEYNLAANCLRPWDGWVRNRPSETVQFITGRESNTRYPNRGAYTTKWTYTAALIQGATGGIQKVRVIPWPTEAMTIEYQYSKRAAALTFDGVAGTDTPDVPKEDLLCVADRAAFMLAVDKNDDRANGYFEQSNRRLDAMVERYIAMQRPSFRPAYGSSLGVG